MKRTICALLVFACLSTALVFAAGQDEGAAESDGPVKLSMFVQMDNRFDPEYVAVQKIMELANVEMEYITPPRESFVERKNILLASGDFPDIIEGLSVSEWKEGAEKGAFIPLDPYIDAMPNIMKYTYPDALGMTKIDGVMYTIPRCTISRGDTYLVRKDWLENLDLDPPETLADYEVMMRAFAKGDPDGNGKDDTYALTDSNTFPYGAFSPSYYNVFNVLMSAFGCGFGWQDDGSGTLVNSDYIPEFKEFLTFARDLMADGVIDPNLITNKNYTEPFHNGVTGMLRAYSGSYERSLADVRKKNSNADLMFIAPPVQENGDQFIHGTARGAIGYMVVTAQSEHPREAVGYLDSLLSDDIWSIICYGVEGVHYEIEDGEKVFDDEAFTEYSGFRTWLAHVRRPTDVDFYLAANMDPEARSYSKSWLEKTIGWNKYDLSLRKTTPALEQLVADDWPAKQTELIMKIIYGELPVDAWDTFVEDLYDAGFDQYEKEINEWYKSL